MNETGECAQMNAVKRLFKITVKYNFVEETFENDCSAHVYTSINTECERHSTTNARAHTATHNRNKYAENERSGVNLVEYYTTTILRMKEPN